MRRLAVLFLAGAVSASAGESDDGRWCRNGLFPTEPPFALARIAGKGRAWFLEDDDGCPGHGASCRQGSYVVPGDTVLTNRTKGAFTCAFFPNRAGGSAGWIDTDRLQPLPVSANPPRAAWTGRWADGADRELRITAHRGNLQVSGEAYWPGRNPARNSPYQSVHTGEIEGDLAVRGNRGEHGGKPGCHVEFTLLGDYLVAGDNMQCGGANVTFSSVYRRMKR